MDSLNAHLDVISERLITIGGGNYTNFGRIFLSSSGLTETTGTFDKNRCSIKFTIG